MKTTSRAYALTNIHGLRLMIVSGRVGAPPHAASAPNDATDVAGGLPLVTRSPLPSTVPGCEGAVIGLEFDLGSRTGVTTEEIAASPDGAIIAREPFSLSKVRRAVFADDQQRIEFSAGLATLGISDPRLKLASEPSLYDGLWGMPAVPSESSHGRGSQWVKQLDRQERVSAAQILGGAVARGRRWSQVVIRSMRHRPRDEKRISPARLRVRRCASAIATLDFVKGWTADDLVDALGVEGGDAKLADFASAYRSSLDPFAETAAVEPFDAPTEAIAFLIDHQGLTASEVVEALTQRADAENDETVPPLAAALVGIAIGRSQLPLALRPPRSDVQYVGAEIRAARDAISLREADLPDAAGTSKD